MHDMIGEMDVDKEGKVLHYLKNHIDFNVYLNEDDKEVRNKERKRDGEKTRLLHLQYLSLHYFFLSHMPKN